MTEEPTVVEAYGLPPASGPGQGEPARSTPGSASPSEIDVQQLADRVYRLMLADIRLERARGHRMHGARRR
jgi:hypothetical protein